VTGVDLYARAGRRWASGAMRVYGPIAEELVDMCPAPLSGCRVLDAGAGTGAASSVLDRRGARPIAMDLSLGMLTAQRAPRAMRVAGDVRAVPLRDGAVDATVAAFVLNHLADPSRGFAELARVTRGDGHVLATVFSNSKASAARDHLDEVLADAGWRPPDWYVELKEAVIPLLGGAAEMEDAARSAGLRGVRVEERAVDVGLTEPEDLVDYRLGQAQFGSWLDEIGPDEEAEVRRRAAEAVRPIMEPYRPIVVFLCATAG
jgi:ubiquinone/menaquinone biosynthesis C-methylase UbiE